MSSILPKPIAVALVLCDNVYEDSTKKRALIGLFTRISSVTFPATLSRLCVFVSVTELRHNTQCKIDIVNAETDEPLLHMEGPLEQDNPTTICDLVFELRNLTFPVPGTYYVRFWGNNEVIIQRPIEAVQLTQEVGDDE